uniref:Actin-related protein 4 n=1 Tax=Oryza meridionalis TaxID=40149 RepID=A0A0E0EHN7_9ORYZ
MYGGDEVSAIVIDVGSYSCKAGYAGDDTPKAVFPSVVGSIEQTGETDEAKADKEAEAASDSKNGAKPMDVDKAKTKRKLYVGQELEFRRDHMEVISPMKDGTVTDWDIVDNIWNHAFRQRLLINPEEHPMLIAEPSINTGQQREKAAELMFEKYKVPALFLAKNAVLTSFASGRATSLSVATSPIGGEFLTDCMMKSLESKGVVIRPRYSFKKKEVGPGEYKVVDLDLPNTTESYKLYCMRAIASDIKESVCRVPDTAFDEVAYANVPTTSYELPDGQTIEVGADRFKIPDILFNPSLSQTIPGVDGFADSMSVRGLPRMVIDSVNRCDVDIRKELLSSILLKERLEKEVLEESSGNTRVKVLASGNSVERRFSVWIGGSILASLGSFQQMWFSKAETWSILHPKEVPMKPWSIATICDQIWVHVGNRMTQTITATLLLIYIDYYPTIFIIIL